MQLQRSNAIFVIGLEESNVQKNEGGRAMFLYHGSNLTVSEPRLVEQNRFLDFGYGFYTTTNKAQAIGFADKVTKRRKEGVSTVSIYEIDEVKAFSECSVLRFDAPDEAW